MESIREMMQAGSRRLMLNVNDVRHFDTEMAAGLLGQPAGIFSLAVGAARTHADTPPWHWQSASRRMRRP